MLNSISGSLAAFSWFLLSLVTVAGVVAHGPENLKINTVMAGVFVSIAVFLAWRTRAVARLRRNHPADPATSSFLRTQLIADLAMTLLGLTLASAAGLRVWLEGMPVFG
ncbi:hypothetical protein [Roseovarius indicus]|uniref:hypothetical protein n=1 Tax=Roseovarius indicus TaxID=540747 RepID=UPI0010FF5F94|nr:hypothetical protein [Roseovarius indicus]